MRTGPGLHVPREADAFLERQKIDLTAKGSPMTSSTYRGLRKGLPVEVHTILGYPFRRGADSRLKTPLLEAAVLRPHTGA